METNLYLYMNYQTILDLFICLVISAAESLGERRSKGAPSSKGAAQKALQNDKISAG